MRFVERARTWKLLFTKKKGLCKAAAMFNSMPAVSGRIPMVGLQKRMVLIAPCTVWLVRVRYAMHWPERARAGLLASFSDKADERYISTILPQSRHTSIGHSARYLQLLYWPYIINNAAENPLIPTLFQVTSRPAIHLARPWLTRPTPPFPL